jgi:mannose-6-phosphate isomerase-like protein (cupin superfamily)
MMKKYLIAGIIALSFSAGLFFSASGKQKQQTGYILEHEKDIAAAEPGPHKGGGNTTAHRFFKNATDSKLQFTKRLLHPGAAIGYHLQKEEEIYYIASGTGEMSMNGETFPVKAGDAILTLAGSSHGLKQTGTEDLVVIINYERK